MGRVAVSLVKLGRGGQKGGRERKITRKKEQGKSRSYKYSFYHQSPHGEDQFCKKLIFYKMSTSMRMVGKGTASSTHRLTSTPSMTGGKKEGGNDYIVRMIK